jgi:hypothetical protein
VPESLQGPFNPKAYEGPGSILGIPGGIRFYFSSKRSGGLGGADIWYSDLVNGQWNDPVNLGAPVNSSFNDAFFRILPGGWRAYFISQRTGSRGDHDIWVTDWVSGEWTTPVNLGDSINSVYSDQSPTVSGDDQEMYFGRTGPGMVEPQIFTARKANSVWQGAVRVGPPIHPVRNWYDGEPYLLPPGDRLYYSGPEDTIPPYTNWDIWYVDRLVGVEETAEVKGQRSEVGLTAKPNPFTSFAILPGHEAERFSLYDISGRKVGTYRGDRVGEGLGPGVYFVCKGTACRAPTTAPLRIVKVR